MRGWENLGFGGGRVDRIWALDSTHPNNECISIEI